MALSPFVSAMVIPTGVGASIGGYGGDAMPHMNLLASVSDVLITHPNVANAAMFQSLPANALYVEGFGLDQFFKGEWHLLPVRKNRIGVVFDAGISPEMLTLHRNTVNAVKTVYGVEMMGEALTSEPLAVTAGFTPAGSSTGGLKNPHVLLQACEALLKQGAEALALCVQMPELTGEDPYKTGQGVDPVGGVEAILSHLVVSTFQVPCAHAPVFSWENAQPVLDELVDPRAASEFITPTFLPCVLTGLAKAPRFVEAGDTHTLSIEDLQALVIPANAWGGIPMLCALERPIPIILVTDNKTQLPLQPGDFLSRTKGASVYPVSSYLEAAGLLQALKLGLSPSVFNIAS